MNISDLIVKLGVGQIAKANFAGEEWFVTWSAGFLRYYNNGEIGDTVPLTYSNVNADYEILNG